MNELQRILVRLNEIVKMENNESLDQLGSYLVGALIIDEAGYKLYQSNETIARIAELGSDIETGNRGERNGWKKIGRKLKYF